MSNQSKEWFLIIFVTVLIISAIFCGIRLVTTEIHINQVPESTNITTNEDLLFVDSYILPTAIAFGNDIGRLSWEDGKMKFEGDAYESAKIFFDYFLVMYLDDYIEARIAKEKGLAIDEQEMILFEFATGGEFAKEFRPQLFLKVTNTDLSRCFINSRLRVDLNGEIYWIELKR